MFLQILCLGIMTLGEVFKFFAACVGVVGDIFVCTTGHKAGKELGYGSYWVCTEADRQPICLTPEHQCCTLSVSFSCTELSNLCLMEDLYALC